MLKAKINKMRVIFSLAEILTAILEKVVPVVHINSLGCFSIISYLEKTAQRRSNVKRNNVETSGRVASGKDRIFPVLFLYDLKKTTR